MYDTPWQLRTPTLCSISATHMLPTLPSHQCMQEMDSYVNLPKQSLLLNNQLVALKVTIIVHLHLSKRCSFLSGRDVVAIVPGFGILWVVNNSFLFLRLKIRAKQTRKQCKIPASYLLSSHVPKSTWHLGSLSSTDTKFPSNAFSRSWAWHLKL